MAKSTSVKKALKSNKKKKFSFKNLDFKKNWKKLSYLGLAGFLAVSSVGYGVWSRVEENRANALSYTYWGSKTTTKTNGASHIKVCRVNTLRQTTTLRFKMIKIGSGYEKFSIVTDGTDYYWGTSISGQYAEGELYNVGVNSLITSTITGPWSGGSGGYWVNTLTLCN